MSSLFNYELDEKQIRLTLHDAELEYNNADWQDFDSNYSETVSKTHKNPLLNLPKINLNINRNVLVPLFFIIGLGGVSAIMFKFINIKYLEFMFVFFKYTSHFSKIFNRINSVMIL